MAEVLTGADSSADESAAAEETARVENARAEMYDEAVGDDQGEGLIMGKYNSQDELVAGYKALQAEYSKLKSGQPVEEQPVAEPEPEQQITDDEDQEPALTPEMATQIREQMMTQVGGAERYQAVAGWAAKNLPEERVQAFNDSLAKGDQAQIINQLKGLQYDHMMATGYEPKLSGGRAPSSEVRGFESEAQVVRAMQDPRYSGNNPDPAYIREVEQKIAVSGVFATK